MRENLQHLELREDFLVLPLKVESVRGKIDKLDLIRNKTFAFMKLM